MSENDIIIRTHYESPLRMHIDSDILTPSSEPIALNPLPAIRMIPATGLTAWTTPCRTTTTTSVCRAAAILCYSGIYRKLSKNITQLLFHCPFYH